MWIKIYQHNNKHVFIRLNNYTSKLYKDVYYFFKHLFYIFFLQILKIRIIFIIIFYPQIEKHYYILSTCEFFIVKHVKNIWVILHFYNKQSYPHSYIKSY